MAQTSIARLFLQVQLTSMALRFSISSNALPGKGPKTVLNGFMGVMGLHPS